MDEQMAYAMAEYGDYGECFVAEEPEVRTISMEEVAKHSSPEDCWVVLHGHLAAERQSCVKERASMQSIGRKPTDVQGRVYDLTKFALGHVALVAHAQGPLHGPEMGMFPSPEF